MAPESSLFLGAKRKLPRPEINKDYLSRFASIYAYNILITFYIVHLGEWSYFTSGKSIKKIFIYSPSFLL